MVVALCVQNVGLVGYKCEFGGLNHWLGSLCAGDVSLTVLDVSNTHYLVIVPN